MGIFSYMVVFALFGIWGHLSTLAEEGKAGALSGSVFYATAATVLFGVLNVVVWLLQ